VELFRKLAALEVGLLQRDELISLLLCSQGDVRLRFTSDWLERQPTDRLRLLFLMARLYGTGPR
jgi:hypothetical protein